MFNLNFIKDFLNVSYFNEINILWSPITFLIASLSNIRICYNLKDIRKQFKR